MDRKESNKIIGKGVKDPFWAALKERIESQIDPRVFLTLVNSDGIKGYWHRRGQQEGMRLVLDIVNSAHKNTVRNAQSPSSEEKG